MAPLSPYPSDTPADAVAAVLADAWWIWSLASDSKVARRFAQSPLTPLEAIARAGQAGDPIVTTDAIRVWQIAHARWQDAGKVPAPSAAFAALLVMLNFRATKKGH